MRASASLSRAGRFRISTCDRGARFGGSESRSRPAARDQDQASATADRARSTTHSFPVLNTSRLLRLVSVPYTGFSEGSSHRRPKAAQLSRCKVSARISSRLRFRDKRQGIAPLFRRTSHRPALPPPRSTGAKDRYSEYGTTNARLFHLSCLVFSIRNITEDRVLNELLGN